MAKCMIKDIDEYSNALTNEVHRLDRHKSRLEKILKNSKKVLADVSHLKIFPLEDELFETIEALLKKCKYSSSIVILGTAKARAVNFLLGENILPSLPDEKSLCRNWRGIRIQYGCKRQYKYSLDNDTEVVEKSNIFLDSNWDEIPQKELNRNDPLDFSTIMDIELCNPLLKSGIEILIPPDLEDPTFQNNAHVVKSYNQWSSILRKIVPVLIYSTDETTCLNKSVKFDCLSNLKFQFTKYENIANVPNVSKTLKKDNSNVKNINNCEKANSKFYIDYNLEFENSEINNESQNSGSKTINTKMKNNVQSIDKLISESHKSPLFDEDNLLFLCQMYKYHPNSKILFLMFSDNIEHCVEAFEVQNPEKILNNKTTESQSSSCSEQYENEIKYKTTNNQHNDEMSKKQKTLLITMINQLNILFDTSIKENSFLGYGLIADDKELKNKKPNMYRNISFKDYKVGMVVQRFDFIEYLVKFSKRSFQNFMLIDCKKISEVHNTLLQQFILSSYDMAREMQVIPTKIKYVAEMEQQLYNTLHKKFSDEKELEELLGIIQKVLQELRSSILSYDGSQSSSCCQNECINLTLASSIFYTILENKLNSKKSISQSVSSVTDRETLKSLNLNDYHVITSSQSSSARSSPIPENENAVENEGFEAESWFNKNSSKFSSVSNILDFQDTDVLKSFHRNTESVASGSSQTSFKCASLEVQHAVLAKLSRSISIRLMKYVDCLKDSYFGTLQRCLDSLEEGRCRRSASEAVRQILLVTNTVDLQHFASFSFLHAFIDQLRRFFYRLSLFPNDNKSCCVKSPEWRRQVALNTIDSLSAVKLAKLISSQLKEKIRVSHDKFQDALHMLSEHHSERLSQTEEIKLAVRKLHAPRFARLCLESTSLIDFIRYGLPRLGKEIGRGQYGVVFLLKGSWGGYESCAIKSVVPPDDKHFNELAMEFFHTRNIPTHDRIVKLLGSVIDYAYLNGNNPSVLLISERLKWDLHCALAFANMSFLERMQITIDIVEGIRFLHSLGLVHRDIKLKNVLLDDNNRAKLTDLGFCIPEPMISGSVVGTPVHMAPELLTGVYDNSVDIYAFGILFWYVCAGSVKLPSVYENIQNKEQLWNDVKKGLRPEKLPQFSDVCWELMEQCWATNPSERPLPGIVQPIVEKIKDNFNPSVDNTSDSIEVLSI